MFRLAALSAAAFAVGTATTGDNCAGLTKERCRTQTGCKWSGKYEVCWDKNGEKPTGRPGTPAPSPAPSMPPTPSPSPAPTMGPTVAPTYAELVGECGDIASRDTCLGTLTCAYKQKEQACVGCADIDSRNTCDSTVGCRWRQQQCSVYLEEPHPNDDACMVHNTKRHCRQAEGCSWNRNGKCRGLTGCADQKNSIACRGAYNCYWMPRTNTCVDLEPATPVDPVVEN